MYVPTTRFGPIQVEAEDIIRFPEGFFGLPECRHWVLLADAQNDALVWLQSTTRADLAFAAVSPRRFVPAYQLRISRSELKRVELEDSRGAQVLVIVGKNERGITLNLKAPLLINVNRRVGRQVIHNGEQPLQYELSGAPRPLRKTA